jgi:hypothetical protein
MKIMNISQILLGTHSRTDYLSDTEGGGSAFTTLHGATSQETVFFVVTCVRNKNITESEHCPEGAY